MGHRLAELELPGTINIMDVGLKACISKMFTLEEMEKQIVVKVYKVF